MTATEENISFVKRISQPLYQVRRWIIFAGVLFIILGIIQILTVWGILLAWLPIWMGVLLFFIAKASKNAHETELEPALIKALNRLKVYFRLLGIFLLIMLLVGLGAVAFNIIVPLLSSQ